MTERKIWSWRQAIGRSGLGPTTKLVLLSLSTFMNEHGQGCYPTIKQLCAFTSLSKQALHTHLNKAYEAGFLEKSKHGFAGQRWANNEYKACWPNAEKLVNEMDYVDQEGSQGDGPPSQKGSQPHQKGSQPHIEKVVNEVDTNSPYNSPINSPASYASRAREEKLTNIHFDECEGKAKTSPDQPPPDHRNISKKDLDRMREELFEAAGDGIQHTNQMIVMREPRMWLSWDDPPDWELDIIPTVQELSARAVDRGELINSWSYFTSAIRQNQAARLAGNQHQLTSGDAHASSSSQIRGSLSGSGKYQSTSRRHSQQSLHEARERAMRKVLEQQTGEGFPAGVSIGV